MADANSVVTPIWAEWFRKLIGSSDRSTSGYQKLPGGFIVQWGVTASLSSGTTNAVTFPLTFPNACLQVIAGFRNNSASATTATGHIGTGNYAVGGFDLYNRMSIAGVCNWMAVGH